MTSSTPDRVDPFIRSPSIATLADSIKNSPRRMTSQIAADPLAPSSSTSSINGRSDQIAANGGNSAGPSDIKPKPKRKKKGWKGWALVIEDDDGNVLEVRDRGESPEHGENGTLMSAGPSRGSAMNSDSINNIPLREQRRSQPPSRPVVTLQPAPPRRKSVSPYPRKKSSPATTQDQASSHKSLTPLTSPEPRSPTTSPGSIYAEPDLLPIAKRARRASPKSSLSPAPEIPDTAPRRPKPPAPTNPPKSKQTSNTPVPSQPTRSGTATVRQEARQAQATSRNATPPVQPIFYDDQPLPKVPRVGMGEVYPPPPESNIRSEADFIIRAAKRKREEDECRATSQSTLGGKPNGMTPPPTSQTATPASNPGKGIQNGVNGSHIHSASRTERVVNGSSQYNTPQTANHPSSTDNQPFPSRTSPPLPPPTSRHSDPGPALPVPAEPSSVPRLRDAEGRYAVADHLDERFPPGSFEAEMRAIEAGYQNGANSTPESIATAARAVASSLIAPQDVALGRGPSDMIPPRFHEGQKPQVVLANPSHRPRVRDKLDRDHQDGFSGLSAQMETDCDGFVENVRENLRNILQYFFPQPTPRRDAFLERVGRNLIELGWLLTDNGDLALHPARPVAPQQPVRQENGHRHPHPPPRPHQPQQTHQPPPR